MKYTSKLILNGTEYEFAEGNPHRTFTVTFTETSDPTQFNPVWSDDAAGLTAGSTAFDEFFGYSGVRLNGSGVETAEITQTASGGAGKLDITQLGTLTSGDNVMIKFPVRGVKMSKNGSTITLSITDEIGRESEGYQYYAFQKTGDIEANASTTVATSPLYIGTYLSYTDTGNVLKSWSGKAPTGGHTMGNDIIYAGNNGTGYTISGWYQRQLISAYYMMKYGNPDSQTIVGKGCVSANSAVNTGGTDNQINATYGTSSATQQMKLFGLEDWRGNKHQRVGGMFTDSSSNIRVALHDFTSNTSTSQSQYKNAGKLSLTSSYHDLSSILGDNKGMFGFNATVDNNSFDTYWCDAVNVSGSKIAYCGGGWSDTSSAGAFRLGVDWNSTSTENIICPRIMYL